MTVSPSKETNEECDDAVINERAVELYHRGLSRVKPVVAAEIGMQVIYEAVDIFQACGALEDFGMQSQDGTDTVIFGGSNRLLWSLHKGFWASESHCTKRFLRLFEIRQKEDIKKGRV